MKKAIEKAIYYTSNIPTFVPIATYEYSNKENFLEILNFLVKDPHIISNFAPKDDISYEMIEYLYTLYDKLLLDQVSSLYIFNRKDVCIQISKTGGKGLTAILKIDAIIAEYPRWNKFVFPLLFLTGFATGIISLEYLKSNLL